MNDTSRKQLEAFKVQIKAWGDYCEAQGYSFAFYHAGANIIRKEPYDALRSMTVLARQVAHLFA